MHGNHDTSSPDLSCFIFLKQTLFEGEKKNRSFFFLHESVTQFQLTSLKSFLVCRKVSYKPDTPPMPRSVLCAVHQTPEQPLPTFTAEPEQPLSRSIRGHGGGEATAEPSHRGVPRGTVPAALQEWCQASREAPKPPPVTSRAARAAHSFAFFSISAIYWIQSDSYLQPFCSLSVLIAVYTTTCSWNYIAYSLLLIDWQGN